MACAMGRFFVAFGLLMLVSRMQLQYVDGAPQVPCYYIFGDSLADNGNNNRLPTLAKSNYPPYGIDFPDGPTGRFCNGKTSFDIIAELLGFDDFIQPFATADGLDILKGVNYASGSAGIRFESGQHLGKHISLHQQLENHQITVQRIVRIQKSRDSAFDYLGKCLYSVGMGSNDYINNYFLPQYYSTSKRYRVEEYAQVLIDQYSMQIKRLYRYGARKIALFGVGLIGCTPNAISTIGTNGSACVDKMNIAALLFNTKLKSLVDQLNIDLPNANLIFINSVGMSSDDPSTAGFKVVNVGCCPVNSIGQCEEFKTPCQNRSEYVFFDGYHPTEALNQITARRSYTAFDPSDTYPYDISHLVSL